MDSDLDLDLDRRRVAPPSGAGNVREGEPSFESESVAHVAFASSEGWRVDGDDECDGAHRLRSTDELRGGVSVSEDVQLEPSDAVSALVADALDGGGGLLRGAVGDAGGGARARAAAHSPSGCAIFCMATGATIRGAARVRRPRDGTAHRVSTSETSTRHRGQRRTEAYAAALARSVVSVSAPAREGAERGGVRGRRERSRVSGSRDRDHAPRACRLGEFGGLGEGGRTSGEIVEVLLVHDALRRALEVVEVDDGVQVHGSHALGGHRARCDARRRLCLVGPRRRLSSSRTALSDRPHRSAFQNAQIAAH